MNPKNIWINGSPATEETLGNYYKLIYGQHVKKQYIGSGTTVIDVDYTLMGKKIASKTTFKDSIYINLYNQKE